MISILSNFFSRHERHNLPFFRILLAAFDGLTDWLTGQANHNFNEVRMQSERCDPSFGPKQQNKNKTNPKSRADPNQAQYAAVQNKNPHRKKEKGPSRGPAKSNSQPNKKETQSVSSGQGYAREGNGKVTSSCSRI